jgi:hypothetical protein
MILGALDAAVGEAHLEEQAHAEPRAFAAEDELDKKSKINQSRRGSQPPLAERGGLRQTGPATSKLSGTVRFGCERNARPGHCSERPNESSPAFLRG